MKNIKTLLLATALLFFTACGNKVPYKVQEPLENAALVYIYVPLHVSASDSDNSSNYSIRINNKPTLQRIEQGEFISLNLKPEAMTISATKTEVIEEVLQMNLNAGQIYYLKIVDDMADGGFEFYEVPSSEAVQEIAQTGEAGTNVESPENIITEYVGGGKNDSVVKADVPATAAMTEAEIDAMIERKLAQKSSANSTVVRSVSNSPSSDSIPVIAPIGNTQQVKSVKRVSVKSSTSQTDEILKAYEMKEKGIISDAEFKSIKANIINK